MSINNIFDFTSKIAPIIGLVIAWYGVSTWQRELYTKNNLDVYTSFMEALFEVHQSLLLFMTVPEDITKDHVIHSGGERVYILNNFYNEKNRNLDSVLNKLEIISTKAELIWGINLFELNPDLITDIQRIRNNVFNYVLLQRVYGFKQLNKEQLEEAESFFIIENLNKTREQIKMSIKNFGIKAKERLKL